MNSKLKKLISGFLILAELAFLILVIPLEPAKADLLPPPPTPHYMTAAIDNGVGTITDQSNVIGAEGIWKLTAVDWTLSSNMSGSGVVPTNPLIYEFGGLTTATAPYYFAVETREMGGWGIVRYDSSSKKYVDVSKEDFDNQLASATPPTLSTNQVGYLKSFFVSPGSSWRMIYNLTNTDVTIGPIRAAIECDDYKPMVTYTPETLGDNFSKFSLTDQARVTAGLLPIGSKIKAYYMPPGSPGVYLDQPVKTIGMADNAKGTFKLSDSGLQPGYYGLSASFAVRWTDSDPRIYSLDARGLSENEGWSSFWQRIGMTKWGLNMANGFAKGSVGGLPGGLIGAASGGAPGAKYEAYTGMANIQVNADGTITGLVAGANPAQGCPVPLVLERDTSRDMTVGNVKEKTACDNLEGSFITIMFKQAFCALMVTMKQWADEAYFWSVGLLAQSIGLSTDKTYNPSVTGGSAGVTATSGIADTGATTGATGGASVTGGTGTGTGTGGTTSPDESAIQFRVLANITIANRDNFEKLARTVTTDRISKPNENPSAVWIKIGVIGQDGNWVSDSSDIFYGKAEYFMWDTDNKTVKVKFTATQSLPLTYSNIGILGGIGENTYLFTISVKQNQVNKTYLDLWPTYPSN